MEALGTPITIAFEVAFLTSLSELIGAQETRRALLCSGLHRSEQRPDLPNMCSHGPARLYVFAGPDPMLEITVAVALAARAPCP